MKVCTLCKEEKDVTNFSWRIKKKGLRQTRCKPCRNLNMREHRLAHIDSYKEKDRLYNLNNKEKIANRKALYYQHNREEINAKAIAGWSSHYNRNRINYIYKGRARVSQIKEATPIWAELNQIKELYKEAKMLEDSTEIKYHIDHIVPLKGKSVCGLHCIDNLQILTATANLSKGNRV